MRHLAIAVLAAIVALIPASAAFAADAPGPLWQKACNPPVQGQKAAPACWVEQFAVSMPQKVIMLRLRFERLGADGARMVATAPLGVLLPAGLTLTLDGGKPLALPFERCSGQGCDAVAVLDRAAVEQFVKGKTLLMHYAATDKAAADIPIQLDGLAAALKSLSP